MRIKEIQKLACILDARHSIISPYNTPVGLV